MTVDFENELLLVTAASGKQASTLLPLVTQKWKRLRLQCVSDSSRQRLQKQYPDAEIVQSEFDDISKATKLMEGVLACVLVTPAFHPRASSHGFNMIDAAEANVRAGGPFQHMLYSSAMYPNVRSLTMHDNKRYVEKALLESGLPFTIIQPNRLMDNTPVRELAQQEVPVMKISFDAETRFSLTALHDLGEATAKILENRDQHLYATYQLCSSHVPINYNEAAEILSSIIGKTVTVEKQSFDQSIEAFAKHAIPVGIPDSTARALVRNFSKVNVYFDKQSCPGNANMMAMVLGRKPLSWKEWVEMQLK